MKKSIYFVQVGFEFDGSVYLPYAAGTIIANCLSKQNIRDGFDFAGIIFRREKLAAALDKIREPYLVAFSCNVWNMEYNKALARLVKEKYPYCIINFGGHSVSPDCSLLRSEEYIDLLMFGEGEDTFTQLLEHIGSGELDSVSSIAYRKNDEIKKTEKSCVTGREIDYPSPYLTGVFDDILKQNPGTDFLSVLETNRGCPYACAYCDWVNGKKMRFFPMEKVLGEIKWLAEHKIEYCFCADSNFGMFERDLDIAHALVDAKKKYGYPKVFRPCYEKNSAERVFEICRLLNTEGMDKGATMAYQTLCDEALEKAGRKNLTMEHFSALMKKYNEAGIPTYSELILGLPGETKESFCRGICRLMENGQHNSLSVYHCEVLPNSDLSRPEYIEENKIEIIKVGFNHIHSAPKRDEEVREYSYLVRSTATMSRDDWVGANLFSVCAQCFHSLGLLRFFAIYLYTGCGVSYYDFYSGLLDFIMSTDGRIRDLWMNFKDKYTHSLEGDWNFYSEKFGNVTWFFEEGAFLEAVSDMDEWFRELMPYLTGYNIDPVLFGELLTYQKAMVRKPREKEFSLRLGCDFPAYFEAVINGNPVPLAEKQVMLTVKPYEVFENMHDYARETVWFGRRRGRTVYGKKEQFKETL